MTATNSGLNKMVWDHPMSLNGPAMMEQIISGPLMMDLVQISGPPTMDLVLTNGPPMMDLVLASGPPMMDQDPTINGQQMRVRMKHPLEPGKIPNQGQV